MKCAILAAGEGVRLRDISSGKPKGLIPLLGITLIERVILSFRESGIRDFLIVTGYRADDLVNFLGNGGKYGVKLEFHYNDKWQSGNGTSLYVLKDYLEKERNFFVTMSDHIFQPEMTKEFTDHLDSDDISILCTQSKANHTGNIADATKVRVNDKGYIEEIGKDLKQYNSIDCGLFCFTPDIFHALEIASGKAKYALTDGAAVLVANEKLKSFDIKKYYWQDVDDKKDLQTAGKKIISNLSSPRDGLVSKYLNRRLSIPLTRCAVRLPISANFVSFVSFLTGLFSGLLFFLGLPLLGGLIAQLCSVIDGMDGEIARLKFQRTPFGGLFDSLLDRYADAAIIIGMSYFAYTKLPSLLPIVFGLLALVGSPMSMLFKERFHTAYGTAFVPEKMDGFTKYLVPNRDGRLFLIMLGGITSYILPVLIYLGTFANLQVIYRLVASARKR